MSKLETNTIDTVSGTSTLQVGSTNTSTITLGVSGDTINVPSGVTIANSGTDTGFGGVNTPAFFAYLEANQGSINDTSFTKVAYDAELFDVGSGFNTSTNTYTIPEAGKYFFSFQVRKSNFTGARLLLEVRLNGSGIRDLEHGTASAYGAVTGSFIRSFSANDTVDAYLYQQSGGTQTIRGGTNAKDTWMYGFKIIE